MKFRMAHRLLSSYYEAGNFEGGVYMSKNDRDMLEILQSELNFIEKGGYGRSVRTPWKAKSLFEDSPTCINYAYLEKAHPCNECHLIDFVPVEKRSEKVPCHFIALDESGETVDSLELDDNQHQLEQKMKVWLRAKIKQVESGCTAAAAPGS